MSESTGTVANPPGPPWALTSAAGAIWVSNDIEDDVVRALRVGVDASHSIEPVECERGPDLPGHHVVGTGGVSADAKSAHSDSASIKGKSTAKHIHATNAVTDHRISWRAEVLRAALARLETRLAEPGLAVPVAIRDTGVDGVAVLQAVEAAARLHRSEQVGSRQGEAARKKACPRRAAFAKAEGIGRVRLLSRNNTAPKPLVDELSAREGNGTHGTVIGNQCAPHVEAKAAVATVADDTGERCLEGLPTGQ